MSCEKVGGTPAFTSRVLRKRKKKLAPRIKEKRIRKVGGRGA